MGLRCILGVVMLLLDNLVSHLRNILLLFILGLLSLFRRSALLFKHRRSSALLLWSFSNPIVLFNILCDLKLLLYSLKPLLKRFLLANLGVILENLLQDFVSEIFTRRLHLLLIK